ncbi:MAG: NADH-quinone oxidoreductase subunit C [Planctomycetota bacterium]
MSDQAATEPAAPPAKKPTIKHPALEPLKRQFPEFKLLAREFRDMVTVMVPREKIVEVCGFLRDDPNLRYDHCTEINGIDYYGFSQKTPGRFAVTYGLTSIPHDSRIWLKVFLDPEHETAPDSEANSYRDEEAAEKGDPGLMLPSVCGVWPGAEWMEREVYDMFGIIFAGHPDLRRIMSWNGFGNFPLRKDYPLRGVGEREGYKIVTRETA